MSFFSLDSNFAITFNALIWKRMSWEIQKSPQESGYAQYVCLTLAQKGVKDKYEANEITYVGHSAGARMGATLTAMQPGLVTNAVLVGGGYETKPELKSHGAISFADVMNKADKQTKYIMVYGSADKISPPENTTVMYDKMKSAGFDVTLVEAKGKAHLDLEMTDASVDAIGSLFE